MSEQNMESGNQTNMKGLDLDPVFCKGIKVRIVQNSLFYRLTTLVKIATPTSGSFVCSYRVVSKLSGGVAPSCVCVMSYVRWPHVHYFLVDLFRKLIFYDKPIIKDTLN